MYVIALFTASIVFSSFCYVTIGLAPPKKILGGVSLSPPKSPPMGVRLNLTGVVSQFALFKRLQSQKYNEITKLKLLTFVALLDAETAIK